MSEDVPDFSQDAQQSTIALSDVTDVATQARMLMNNIETAEAALSVMQANYRQLVEQRLPEMFAQLGIDEIKLNDGTKVSVTTFYSAKIPEDKEIEAFKWLEETKNDSIIKSKVDMAFGRGEKEREQEKQVIAELQKIGVIFTHKRGVHPQTLKAFVKQQLEAGEPLPVETFGVYIGKKAVMKEPKK